MGSLACVAAVCKAERTGSTEILAFGLADPRAKIARPGRMLIGHG